MTPSPMFSRNQAPVRYLFGLLAALVCGCGETGNPDPPTQTAPAQQGAGSSDSEFAGSNPTSTSRPSLPPGKVPRGPDQYKVEFQTTKGNFVVQVHREWSPNGADRFYELVESGFYDQVKFFRAVEGFMVQFGISGDPAANDAWRDHRILDDPVVKSNVAGTISFAKPGMPNSRTTQVFINYQNNSNLDGMGFSPFGVVVEGMDVVRAINKEYDEEPSRYQQQIQEQGNVFLEQGWPRLDGVISARVIEQTPPKLDSTPSDEQAAPEKQTEPEKDADSAPADATQAVPSEAQPQSDD